VTENDLLDITSAGGTVTDAGVRSNVSVALRYIEAWLRGIGAVTIDGLMEDAATAEISRSLLRQWIENRITTEQGTSVDRAMVARILDEELTRLRGRPGDRFDDAADIVRGVTLADEFPTFLTLGDGLTAPPTRPTRRPPSASVTSDESPAGVRSAGGSSRMLEGVRHQTLGRRSHWN
jgi:malate synthase